MLRQTTGVSMIPGLEFKGFRWATGLRRPRVPGGLRRRVTRRLSLCKNGYAMRLSVSINIAVTAAVVAASAEAHHSWSGIYDTSKSITVDGVVTEFLVRSPHLALRLDVRNEAGGIEQWTVEWGSKRRLQEAGHNHSTLRPGDEIIVVGQPAWTPGRKSVHMRTLTRASDGFTMTGGRGRGRRNPK